VVEEFELARRAGHEQVNDTLGFAGEMRFARREWIDCGRAEHGVSERIGEQAGEGDFAQADAAAVQEVAAGDG